jgi:carbon-monoxide dehydrogenase small subunit
MDLSFSVNGEGIKLKVDNSESLLSILREHLGLMGSKPGCEVGDCGACSVLVNGELANSCLIKAKQLQDAEVVTIEGLSQPDGTPNDLQQSFITNGATQCGYCTPGMIMASEALLRHTPAPTRQDIREGLKNNLCRCTGYLQIIEAVEATAAIRRTAEGGQDD